ncbi:hypothetical protein LCGC14_2247650 [marine sediment metagenome]|uniref:Phospholipase D-like domain-containing protein n=1 Tax=marine sediment metagenome TaxID=412755 RepID=A0A0F9FG28_9ZZZZ
MAKFLTTLETSARIEKIIKEAKIELTLITPYLKLTKIFLNRLKEADSRNIKIRLIYGKEELKPEEMDHLKELDNLQLYFCEDLHAKCYFNEELMVITSLNLHEYSQSHNREMGVSIKREVDGVLYSDAVKEIDSILKSSINKTIKKTVSLRGRITGYYEGKAYFEFATGQNQWIPESAICSQYEFPPDYEMQDFEIETWAIKYGFCINCSNEILLCYDRPLCKGCYYQLGMEEDYGGKEFKYCHRCGTNYSSFLGKPFCQECWQETRYS